MVVENPQNSVEISKKAEKFLFHDLEDGFSKNIKNVMLQRNNENKNIALKTIKEIVLS